MLDWQQRVVDEYDALSEKMLKLVEFIFEKQTFEALPVTEQTLLRAQLAVMSAYSSILELRMRRFTEKEEIDATGSEIDEEGEGGPDD